MTLGFVVYSRVFSFNQNVNKLLNKSKKYFTKMMFAYFASYIEGKSGNCNLYCGNFEGDFFFSSNKTITFYWNSRFTHYKKISKTNM